MVCQALPNYAMGVFLLPIDLCRDLEKMMNKFWWRGSNRERGINWMAWDRLAHHKAYGGLGFRHLREFNLAMVGKQGWRLVAHPDSLVGRLFKARYYPKGNFLDATLGSNPSYIWRSVWAARNLIRDGIRKRISSGEQTKINGEPWLPDQDNPYVVSEHPELEGKYVVSLLRPNQREWDTGILNELFVERDKESIMNIQLGNGVCPDKWFWKEEKSGVYTVKSAYRALSAQKEEGLIAQTTEEDKQMWRAMWRIKNPPKVSNLIWRAASKCLPTKVNLQSKNVQIEDMCPLCAVELETTEHIFIECSFAKECWMILGGLNVENNVYDFGEWFKQVLRLSDTQKCRLACQMCWAIWRARNDVVWNGVRTDPARTVADACRELKEWDEAQVLTTQNEVEDVSGTRWHRPNHGWLKINVDGTVFESERKFGWACVARNHVGLCIGGRSRSCVGAVSPELAEALGVREALSWSKENGWDSIFIESDCLNVVNAVKNASIPATYIGLILEDCVALMSKFDNVVISFVKRSANKVAHHFARDSCFSAERSFFGEDIPSPLRVLLDDDLME